MEKLRELFRSNGSDRPLPALGAAIALLIALFVLTLSVQVARAEGQPGEGEAVVRAWVDALNQKDADSAISLYAEDAVILALGKEIKGQAAIGERQRNTITRVLNPSLAIQSVEERGDEVVLRVKGENSITRFDNHGPVENEVTFTIRDGKIQREVGPILSQADMEWYRAAQTRFQASGATPSQLPNTGEAGEILPYQWIAMLGIVGMSMLSIGLVIRWRRPRQLAEIPIDDER